MTTDDPFANQPPGWSYGYDEYKATAYHEAGHVVVGVLEGIPIKCTRLTHTDPSVGMASVVVGPGRWGIENQVRTCLAGPIAEDKFLLYNNRRNACRRETYEQDFINARNSLRLIYIHEDGTLNRMAMARHRRKLGRQTERNVERYWSAIHAIACELGRRWDLPGADIYAILRRFGIVHFRHRIGDIGLSASEVLD